MLGPTPIKALRLDTAKTTLYAEMGCETTTSMAMGHRAPQGARTGACVVSEVGSMSI